MTQSRTWSSRSISTGTLSPFKLQQWIPPMTSLVELKRDAFSYDVEQDAYICPAGKQLRLNTLHRSASGLYWLYQADKQDCQSCPLQDKCLSEKDRRAARKLEHSYFALQRNRHLAHRYDAAYRDALKKRQIWCEGTFATQSGGTI